MKPLSVMMTLPSSDLFTLEANSHCNNLRSVFCPGFQKGRVPSEKGTFSAMNGASKGHNQRGELEKKGTISAVNGREKGHY